MSSVSHHRYTLTKQCHISIIQRERERERERERNWERERESVCVCVCQLTLLVGGPRVETLPLDEILDLYWIDVYPISILNWLVMLKFSVACRSYGPLKVHRRCLFECCFDCSSLWNIFWKYKFTFIVRLPKLYVVSKRFQKLVC